MRTTADRELPPGVTAIPSRDADATGSAPKNKRRWSSGAPHHPGTNGSRDVPTADDASRACAV